jgi:hypothetical protein
MRKMLIVLSGLMALVVGAAPGSVAAGGWAVVSYDPLPELVAGEPATISFVVLRHGVNPVGPDDFETGLDLAVTGPNGTEVFPATPTELMGQFAAEIVVPDSTTRIDLAVSVSGGLALQEQLITVPVTPAAAAGGPGWTPAGFGALAVLGAGLLMSRQATTSRRGARHESDAAVPA